MKIEVSSPWSKRAATLCAILTAGLAAVPRGARAQEDGKAEARQHYAQGLEYAKARAYKNAISEFRRAYEGRPHYAVLYNLAQAYLAAGDAANAVHYFERYLAEGGGQVSAERRAKILAILDVQRARTGLALLKVSPNSALVQVDGETLEPSRLDRPIRVNVGNHRVAASLDGYKSAEQAFQVRASELVEVSLPLASLSVASSQATHGAARDAPAAREQRERDSTRREPGTPEPARTPEPRTPEPRTPEPQRPEPRTSEPRTPEARLSESQQDPGGRGAGLRISPLETPARVDAGAGRAQRTAGYVLGGVGLAALAASPILYIAAKGSWNDAIRDGCTKTACGEPARTERDHAQSLITAENVALLGGGILLAAGTVLVLTVPSVGSTSSRQASTAGSIVASIRATGITVGGTF